MSQENEQPKHYALRILPHAERDIDAQTIRMADIAGPDIARLWYEGLFAAIGTLAETPKRHPLIKEKGRFRHEVRQHLYRRASSGPVWRILFVINEGGEDAPTVNLLHIRHGAQRTITRKEAQQIEAED